MNTTPIKGLPPDVHLEPGRRVRIVQTVRTREGDWQTDASGRVCSCDLQPTGSWYAHGKGDRLWLRRVRLERDDGEIVDLILDDRSTVIPLDHDAPGARPSVEAAR